MSRGGFRGGDLVNFHPPFLDMALQSQILVTEPLFLTSDGYLNLSENIYYPDNFHTCTPLAVIPLLPLSSLFEE